MKPRKYLYSSLILLMLFAIPGCDDKPKNPDIVYCAKPAPLLGEFDPKAPGYIVVLNEDVNLKQEVDRLKTIYGIKVERILDIINGFSGQMPNNTREKLRCKETIKYIQHNQSISLPTE